MKNKSRKVIAFGSASLDLFTKTTKCDVTKSTCFAEVENMLCFPHGEKIALDRIEEKLGGGGINSAVSFSRLGIKTAYIGNLGQKHDYITKKIIEDLSSEKVSFHGTFSKHHPNLSIILESRKSDRTILTYRGASRYLDFKKIKKTELKKAGWFYFSSMKPPSLNALVKLSSFAEKNSIKITFNPSYYLVKDYRKNIIPILKRTSILILNKEEAETLLGEECRNSLKHIKKLLLSLASLGPEISIVTNGPQGVYAYSLSSGKFYHLGTKKIKVVDSTGAGDGFASAFSAGIISGKTIPFSLKLGMNNAESIIKKFGAHEGALKKTEALRLTKKDKRIVKEI